MDFFFAEAEGMTEFVEVGGLDFGGEVELAGFAMMVNRADEGIGSRFEWRVGRVWNGRGCL